jgi:hypothetical protein
MIQTNKVNIFYLINEHLLPKLTRKLQLPMLSCMVYLCELRYSGFIQSQRQLIFQLLLDFSDYKLLIFM